MEYLILLPKNGYFFPILSNNRSSEYESFPVKRLKVNGVENPWYFVDYDGNIISCKGYKVKYLTPSHSRTPKGYPSVMLSIDGKGRVFNIHRIVCETFHKIPLPDILTDDEWNSLEKGIREKLLNYYLNHGNLQVNHIDHDVKNYHPSNLEWVSGKENWEKYQEHRKRACFQRTVDVDYL